ACAAAQRAERFQVRAAGRVAAASRRRTAYGRPRIVRLDTRKPCSELQIVTGSAAERSALYRIAAVALFLHGGRNERGILRLMSGAIAAIGAGIGSAPAARLREADFLQHGQEG